MGISSQANLTMREGVSPLLEPAWNFGSSDIPVGQLIARDIAASDSSATADALRRRKSHGIAVPASANVERLWGVVAGVNGRPAKAGAAAQVCTGGLCQAWIDVPASTAIAEGVPLVMQTAWDATNDVVTYYPYLAPYYQNTPTVGTPAVQVPANPVAYLREAIASGSSARQVLAWVDMIPYRAMRPFRWFYQIAVPAVRADFCLGRSGGPGVITGYSLQLLTGGTTSSGTTLEIEISPQRTTSDQVSIFTTAPYLANDCSDGFVAGAGCSLVGDTDTNVSEGTSGTQGVLKALASRQFPAAAIISGSITTVPTSPADLLLVVEGFWY